MVLGQQALHTNVGGPEVMAGQLEHLLAILRLPRLRLGIIPFDAPYRVPLNNGFWILDEALVQFDTYSAELSLAGPTRSHCTGGPSSGWRRWPPTARKRGRSSCGRSTD